MMEIEVGLIFAATTPELKLDGPHRVLQVLPDQDRVVFIPIPNGPCKKTRGVQSSYYARGFLTEKLTTLKHWKAENLIEKAQAPVPPARWSWTDKQIADACPAKKRIWIEGLLGRDGKWTSPDLIKRDRKWDLISPLIELAESGGVPDLSHLDALVEARAKEADVSPGQAYDALHRFYAFGSIKNTLLPNTQKCGAPGRPRFGKNGVRLGRKNAAAAAGNLELAGKICDEEDRENLQDGWEMFVRPGVPVEDAFLATSATFYSAGHTIEHGMRVPNLLLANQRPTVREFQTHGPKSDDRYAAVRRQMGEAEWARNYRLLTGSAQSGIPTIGQVGSLDASPIDVNLNAIFDRLCPVGVGRGLFVRDARFGLWCGWHIAIGGIGTADAKLAILRAATDKTALLKRFNLEDLPPDDFPGLFFSKYLSDNGELRSMDGMESCVDQLASRIEFIASGRADRNSPSESGHHSRHRRFDHLLTGSNRGRQSKRGEPLPITKALLNRYEYERLLLLWMHWANTKQRVPHLVPTEMRRELRGQKFEPTRIAIYRWAKTKGYVSGKPVDEAMLRAHLLPTFTATVRRNGLILHRPGTGDAVELLHDAHFNHEYLAASGLFRSFGKRDKPHVQVKADPDDLSQVLLIDALGTHAIPNVAHDMILVQEGCIADLCAKNDFDKRENVESRSQTDQDASNQRAYRLETEAPAKAEKAAALAERGKVPAKDRKRPKVRANQAADKAAHLDQSAARARPASAAPPAQPTAAQPQATPQSCRAPAPGNSRTTINDALRARLTRFHETRRTK
jgi:hypothetical protein